MSPDGKTIVRLQPYNTQIKVVWSTLVVAPDGKIIGHLQP